MKFLNTLVALASVAAAHPSKGPKLPKGAFDLEGYAKTNPIGSVTGGKGGPTTTITDPAALATAVLVSQHRHRLHLYGY